jgi:hypothetical protein
MRRYCIHLTRADTSQTRTPVLLSLDHDALLVCTHRSSSTELARLETPPAATGVVDAAIRLFGALLASQDTSSATRTLQQLVESVRSPKLEKNNGRRLAVLFNAVIAVSLALREAGSRRAARETFSQASVTAVLSPFLLVRYVVIVVRRQLILRLRTRWEMGIQSCARLPASRSADWPAMPTRAS